MPLIIKNRQCLAKIESSAGTPETLAAADGAENFSNPQFTPNVPPYVREGQGSLSKPCSIAGAQSGSYTVRTELYNNTSNAPFWATVLAPTAGLKLTGSTLTLETGGTATLTFAENIGANRFEIAGAQCNLKLVADKVGEPIKLDWSINGSFVTPYTSSLLTPAYPSIVPPRFVGAALTLANATASGDFIVSKFELDLGNKVTLREDGSNGTTNTTGYVGSVIVDRDPTLKITVEVPLISSHNFYTDLLASTESQFSFKIGNTTSGFITVTAPKLQVREISHSDKEGIFTYDLTCGLNRNGTNGDSELSIVLSQT